MLFEVCFWEDSRPKKPRIQQHNTRFSIPWQDKPGCAELGFMVSTMAKPVFFSGILHPLFLQLLSSHANTLTSVLYSNPLL